MFAAASRLLVRASVLASVVAMGVVASSGNSSAAPVCETFTWNSSGQNMITGVFTSFSTGLTLPAGKSVTATYVSNDGYPNRRNVLQLHEQWAITVGGVRVPGLTIDLPDPIDADEASVSGSLGTFTSPGGAVTIVHASVSDGFNESPNSVRPSLLVLVACDSDGPSSTTTTSTTVVTSTTATTQTTTTPTTAPATTTVTILSSVPITATVLTRLPETGVASRANALTGLALVLVGVGSILVVNGHSASRLRARRVKHGGRSH